VTLTLNAFNTYTGGTTVDGGTLRLGRGGPVGTIRGTVTVNDGAILDYLTANTFGWDRGVSVNVLNINGGTVGGADFGNHFWHSFKLNMVGGELKLGGTLNEFHFPTITVTNDAVISQVSSNAMFGVRDGSLVTTNISAGKTLTIDAPLTQRSGTGRLDVRGDGTLELTNFNNKFSGNTRLFNSSTLLLSGNGRLSSPGSNIYRGNLVINSGTTLQVNSTAKQEWDGVISGPGTINVNAGFLDLGGNSTFSGDVTIASGARMQLGRGGNTGAIRGNIQIDSGGVLRYFRGNTHTQVNNTISGTGTIQLAGTGVRQTGSYTFGLASAFAGNTEVQSGARLYLTHAQGVGSNGIIRVQDGGTLMLNTGSGTVVNNLELSGMGWLENIGRVGAFRLISGGFTGSITLTGNTRIGALRGESGVINASIGERDGSFFLQKWGNGRITLTGASTYSGDTIISGGQLMLANPNGPALYNVAGSLRHAPDQPRPGDHSPRRRRRLGLSGCGGQPRVRC
jgi:autotransporter-associated beta strand protein